jgi:hypothetical protein
MPRRATLLPVLSALLAAGCAATTETRAPDTLAPVPEDLTIDVTVLRDPDLPERSEAHLRPARFVLFANGSLRYGRSEEAPVAELTAWLPDHTRSLRREQVADVWALVEHLGMATPDAGAAPTNATFVTAPDDGMVYLIDLSADGRRWTFTLEAPADPALDSTPVRFVRHLALLAWATDRPQPRISPLAGRYDFGPDPYARYREP